MKLTFSPTGLVCGYGPMPGYRLWAGHDEAGRTYYAFILTVCSEELAGQAVLDRIPDEAVPITSDMVTANEGFQELTMRALALEVLERQRESTRIEIALPAEDNRRPAPAPRPPGKPNSN